MPKLLVFVPCEKIILDDRANASLIVLMQNLDVQVGAQGIPKNAVTPKEWAVFTVWEWLPDDHGKEFTQIIQVLWPDGSEFKRTAMKFQAGQKRYHQNRLMIIGFPAGQVGQIAVNMWLEEDSRKIGDLYSYFLTVSHGELS